MPGKNPQVWRVQELVPRFLLQIGVAGKNMNRLWLSEYVKENKSIRQEMTAKQKDPEVAKSLAQPSSEQNLEHVIEMKSLSENKLLLREKFAESGKTSQSTKGSTKSEQS